MQVINYVASGFSQGRVVKLPLSLSNILLLSLSVASLTRAGQNGECGWSTNEIECFI